MWSYFTILVQIICYEPNCHATTLGDSMKKKKPFLFGHEIQQGDSSTNPFGLQIVSVALPISMGPIQELTNSPQISHLQNLFVAVLRAPNTHMQRDHIHNTEPTDPAPQIQGFCGVQDLSVWKLFPSPPPTLVL